MKENKLLTVFNTCGIKKDNTEWYIKSIESILAQDFTDQRVVLSSCMNSMQSFRDVYSHFRDRISYCYYGEPYTVNITFNKTVQESVKKFGEFDGYLYIDSGIMFNEKNVISNAYNLFKEGPYAFVTIQTDTDTGFDQIGFKNNSNQVQITDKDFVIPVGKACNLHSQIFSNEAFKTYNNKLMPDVFKAYCTESTFSFLCAALKKKWVILKDDMLHHKKGVDGASVSVPHWSPKHNNPWNNLLYNRDALDFIKDEEAISAGLGYEECNKIMVHRTDKYDKQGFSTVSDDLVAMINKYFFLSEQELNYDNIQHRYVS